MLSFVCCCVVAMDAYNKSISTRTSSLVNENERSFVVVPCLSRLMNVSLSSHSHAAHPAPSKHGHIDHDEDQFGRRTEIRGLNGKNMNKFSLIVLFLIKLFRIQQLSVE